MDGLEIKELPLSSKARICWGFLWRSLLVSVGSGVCGGLIGGLISVAGAALGFAKPGLQVAGGAAGVVCGAFFVYFYVRWLLAARLGDFKLVLVRAR